MGIFDRKTPEQKAAEERERQLRLEAEERERQLQREVEERERARQWEIEKQRRPIIAERDRRVREAKHAIQTFYFEAQPKWEYKMLTRNRHVESSKNNYLDAGQWSTDIEAMLPGLGAEGWELVSVWPISDYGGYFAGVFGTPIAVGPVVSGLTTAEKWVFKRPKPPVPDQLATNLRSAEEYGAAELAALK